MPSGRTVEVWGKAMKLETYQRSKSVWIAVGDYMANASKRRIAANPRRSSDGWKPRVIAAAENSGRW